MAHRSGCRSAVRFVGRSVGLPSNRPGDCSPVRLACWLADRMGGQLAGLSHIARAAPTRRINFPCARAQLIRRPPHRRSRFARACAFSRTALPRPDRCPTKLIRRALKNNPPEASVKRKFFVGVAATPCQQPARTCTFTKVSGGLISRSFLNLH